MGPTITVTKKLSGRKDFEKALVALRRAEVLVGIPQSTASRRGEKINNAELLYIQTHGSPIRNIPPRPVLEPAINAPGNREIIARELQEAAAAWLSRNPRQGLAYLKRAGIAGMNAAKAWFTDPRNNWAPNAPSTIARKGYDRPLIDTGALRRAITYVVRGDVGQVSEAEQLELDNAKKRPPQEIGESVSTEAEVTAAPAEVTAAPAESAVESAVEGIVEIL